ncbi:MAG: hypothetical protein K2Q18_15065, partial [Bdellovibrionales bacterium]|nr:hypothetical protein [Bdellovibrionales bacterium]
MSKASRGQKSLVNKFSIVEDTLINEELGYSLSIDDIKKISSDEKKLSIVKNESSNTYKKLFSFILVLSRETYFFVKKYSNTHIYKPTSYLLTQLTKFFKQKKIKTEIELNKYLEVIETDLKVKKEKINFKDQEDVEFKKNHVLSLAKYFNNKSGNYSLDIPMHSQNVKSNIQRDYSVFELMM